MEKVGDISQLWHAQAVDYRQGVEIACIRRVAGMTTHYAKPMEMEWVEYADKFLIQPTLVLSFTQAAHLMQSLWDAGVRPESGHGSGAEASAMQAHIKLAENVTDRLFGLLDVQKEVRASRAAMDAANARIEEIVNKYPGRQT